MKTNPIEPGGRSQASQGVYRLRSRSAVLGRSLAQARRQLAGQFERVGFVLQQFEVRP